MKPMIKMTRTDYIIIFFGCFVLGGAAMYGAFQNDELQTKHTAAMNTYADLWCKGQTYEVTIGRQIDEGYENKYCYIIDKIVEIEKNGDSKHVISVLALDYNASLLNNSIKQTCMDFDNKTQQTIVIENQTYYPVECPYHAIKETQNYATGRYLPDENKIECLDEPEKSQKFEVPME